MVVVSIAGDTSNGWTGGGSAAPAVTNNGQEKETTQGSSGGVGGAGAGGGNKGQSTKPYLALKVTGTVKWFNVKSGYGFINRKDTGEDVFVHQSAIIKNNPKKAVRSVGDGETVEFDVVAGEKGNEAANVTGENGTAVKGSPYAADKKKNYRQWYLSGPPRRGGNRGGHSGSAQHANDGADGNDGGAGPDNKPVRYRNRRFVSRGGGGGYFRKRNNQAAKNGEKAGGGKQADGGDGTGGEDGNEGDVGSVGPENRSRGGNRRYNQGGYPSSRSHVYSNKQPRMRGGNQGRMQQQQVGGDQGGNKDGDIGANEGGNEQRGGGGGGRGPRGGGRGGRIRPRYRRPQYNKEAPQQAVVNTTDESTA